MLEARLCLTVRQEDMDQPLNFKLSKLTSFNIDNRDRTIKKLKNELKKLNQQLRNAQKVSPSNPEAWPSEMGGWRLCRGKFSEANFHSQGYLPHWTER